MRRDNLSAIGPSPSNPIFTALPGGWWAPVTICTTLPNASSHFPSSSVMLGEHVVAHVDVKSSVSTVTRFHDPDV